MDITSRVQSLAKSMGSYSFALAAAIMILCSVTGMGVTYFIHWMFHVELFMIAIVCGISLIIARRFMRFDNALWSYSTSLLAAGFVLPFVMQDSYWIYFLEAGFFVPLCYFFNQALRKS